MAILFKIFLTLLTIISCFGAENNQYWKNYRIYPSNISQTETFIVCNPINKDILFASANTFNPKTGFISEGIYVTTTVVWIGMGLIHAKVHQSIIIVKILGL